MEQTLPLVAASPHSGTCYPDSFIEQSALDPETLRRSEDTFVDLLFGEAPRVGAPLVSAVYPRAYIDLNREPYELDPAMFLGDLPPYVNTGSAKVAAGLGTIARDVSEGANIYGHKLAFSEALERIDGLYRPYHECLISLIDSTTAQFGYCVLLDCHSMPSTPEGMNWDIVLGDRHGLSCAPALVQHVDSFFTRAGLRVVLNRPYAGGHTTSFYGSPRHGIHALQIEIARRLYMNEESHQALPSMKSLTALMTRLMQSIKDLPNSFLLPTNTP